MCRASWWRRFAAGPAASSRPRRAAGSTVSVVPIRSEAGDVIAGAAVARAATGSERVSRPSRRGARARPGHRAAPGAAAAAGRDVPRARRAAHGARRLRQDDGDSPSGPRPTAGRSPGCARPSATAIPRRSASRSARRSPAASRRSCSSSTTHITWPRPRPSRSSRPSSTTLPDGAQLVIASRTKLPLALGRRLAADDVVRLGARHLALSAAETASVLAVNGVEIAAEDAEVLHRRTDGWPTGVALAARALAEGGISAPDVARSRRACTDRVGVPVRRGARPAATADARLPAADLGPRAHERLALRRGARIRRGRARRSLRSSARTC